jgi:hypothetical protein
MRAANNGQRLHCSVQARSALAGRDDDDDRGYRNGRARRP